MIVRTLVKSVQDIMRQDVGVDGDAQRISQLCWMFFLKIIDDQDQELELTKDGYRSPIPEKFQWRNWAADPEGATGQALTGAPREPKTPGWFAQVRVRSSQPSGWRSGYSVRPAAARPATRRRRAARSPRGSWTSRGPT